MELKRVHGVKIRRVGRAGDIGVAHRIDGDAFTYIIGGATQISGIDQRGSGGVELGDKSLGAPHPGDGIEPTATSRLHRVLEWEIGGSSLSRDVSVDGCVNCNAQCSFVETPPE